MSGKADLRSMSYEEIEALMLENGEKKYRAKQIFAWVHQKGVMSIDEMTNLSID